jgi:hypothetical protein
MQSPPRAWSRACAGRRPGHRTGSPGGPLTVFTKTARSVLNSPAAAAWHPFLRRALHCEYGTLADDTALTDVEDGTFARDVDPVIQVCSRSIGKRAPVMQPAVREVGLDEAAGIEQGDTKVFNFPCDRPEDGFGIATLERKPGCVSP